MCFLNTSKYLNIPTVTTTFSFFPSLPQDGYSLGNQFLQFWSSSVYFLPFESMHTSVLIMFPHSSKAVHFHFKTLLNFPRLYSKICLSVLISFGQTLQRFMCFKKRCINVRYFTSLSIHRCRCEYLFPFVVKVFPCLISKALYLISSQRHSGRCQRFRAVHTQFLRCLKLLQISF